MKKLVETYRGVVKGTSSGWMISLLFHVGIGIVATSIFLVVKTQEDEIIFHPVVVRPPIKMDLPPPPVRIKMASKPVRKITRIAVPQNSIERPAVEVPELAVNAGVPLVDLTSGFDPLDTEETLVGGKFGTGFDFVGTFYDFKRDRKGRAVIMDPHQFVAEVAGFIRSGWKTSKFAQFYRSPKQLYASCFMVPPVKSSVAPAAFDEGDTEGYCWLAHYNGQLVYHEDITFRFWGQGDDIMVVRVDGKEVLVSSWPGGTWSPQEALTSAAGGWQSSSPHSRTYALGNNTAVVGDWITLKKGEPVNMDVIIGEVPGGIFCSMLTVEVKGQDYERNRQQAPILPMFKTTEPSRNLKDRIQEWLTVDHAMVSGGPVFRDIAPVEKIAPVVNVEAVLANVEENASRIWNRSDGVTFEAEFVSRVGDTVVLKNRRGKQIRISFDQLSSDDRNFVELAQPPEFNITFTKQSSQRIIETTPYLDEVPPKLLDYTFGAKIRQVSARGYHHTIHAELFVFGQQRIDGRKYILLDHLVSSFVPAATDEESHVFKGNPVELMSYDTTQPLGRKYADYLLILRDERGDVVQYSASANWIFPNLGNLQKLKVGNFLDKTCARVYPTGPGPKSLYQ